MAGKSEENVWGLGGAGQYRDRAGQGCFSPRELASTHSFGWDRTTGSFFVKNFYGISAHYDRLPMPVELAEKFLRRCLKRPFRELFLAHDLYSEKAEEIIELADRKLHVHRSAAVMGRTGLRYIALPALTLSLVGSDGKDVSICLFHELRTSFGNAIRQYLAAAIRPGLRRKLPRKALRRRAPAKRTPAKRKAPKRRRRA